ncbi:MAG: hypothetical protein AAF039_10395 [Bacteroidota bacterium]
MNTIEEPASSNPTFLEIKGVPKWRWYLLKAFYLFVFLAFGIQIWNTILTYSEVWDPMHGIAFSFWAAFAALMGFGIRYPLKMLPLVFLQLMYKTIWLLFVYLPLKSGGNLTGGAMELFQANSIGIALDIIVIPWGYLYRNYLKSLFNLS